MKIKYVAALAVLLLAYFALRPSLTPIGAAWSIGHSRFGSSQSLVRVGDHGLFRRTSVSDGVVEYKFFKPDCVIYRATSSFDVRVYMAVCGERTPIAVEKTDELKITPDGLWGETTHETVDGFPLTVERYIPIGRILNMARLARPFSSSEVPRAGSWKRVVDVTSARYPSAAVEWNAAGRTAMHEAVEMGCINIVIAMLHDGVFPDIRDNNGVTPLMVGLETQSDNELAFEFAEVLLNAGADVNAQSDDGMTPLMYAKRAGAMGTYSRMLTWGADTTLTNKGGETVSQIKTIARDDSVSRAILLRRNQCPR